MKRIFTITLAIVALLAAAVPAFTQNFPGAQGNPSVLSRPGGAFYAPAFQWQGTLIAGNTATGSQTVTIASQFKAADGSIIPNSAIVNTLMPMIFDIGQGAQETVTPTALAVTTCPSGNLGIGSNSAQCINFTGSFNNTHGQSAVVGDGTFGLQTAINYAASLNSGAPPGVNSGSGGGTVIVDAAWAQMGGTTALIQAAIPYPSVVIGDYRGRQAQWYSVQPSNQTALATAAALVNTTPTVCTGTATICSTANATLGGTTSTWTSATVFFCTTYVDLQGHEGPCSPTFSYLTSATVTVQVQPPAATVGAVGYLVYAGASFAAVTRLPVVSGTTGGPTCTLTAVETVTPACAVTNTIYNQTGSVATFALIEASTQPQPPGATITTFTTLQAFDISHTGYAYFPSNVPAPAYTTNQVAFAASTGTSASNWELGRAFLPPGFMNTIGKTVRVSGLITGTANTVPTVTIFVAMGPPWTASVGAKVCTMVNTTAESAVVWNITFSCTITTQTVSIAAGTGGTVLGNGWFMQQFATGTTAGNLAVNNVVSPVTVNLFGGTEIEIILLPTSSTGITSPQLLQLSVEALN